MNFSKTKLFLWPHKLLKISNIIIPIPGSTGLTVAATIYIKFYDTIIY